MVFFSSFPICFEKFQMKLIMEAFEQKLSVA